MKHGSLFSGIGGFDLAAEWIGWENIFHCEIKEFNQKILKYYWPKAITYGDIKQTDFTIHRGSIDVLTGGFPCQPYSLAGKRKGKEDDRHLWPEMLRAIREIKPKWIVGENVYGLVNWNGGVVFNEVQADLEAEGYQVQPVILPACSVNAPHKRDRVWFIAYSGSKHGSLSIQQRRQNKEENINIGWKNESGITSNSPGIRPEGRGEIQDSRFIKREFRRLHRGIGISGWEYFPSVSHVCNGNDGFPSGLDFEAIFKGVKPRKGTSFGKWRRHSIEAGGNAIVPHVALEIFKVIDLLSMNNL